MKRLAAHFKLVKKENELTPKNLETPAVENLKRLYIFFRHRGKILVFRKRVINFYLKSGFAVDDFSLV